ncbi:MAG TPA: sulfatase-like hydrolase/transferase [Bryobacteraceae bacterium]|nr:sulfatase-like hydrolase/transferase [Bryobacteraceae bacterium]
MKWLIGIVASLGLVAAQEPTPVILISIDTLRADHLSAYGYRKIQTPNIDSFAQQGTIFTEVSSQIPLTLPSHTSLLTSTYPFENGVEENAEVVPAGAVTLAMVLRSHGYRTAAFVGSNILERACGLDQGFDEYDSPFGGDRVRRDGALVVRAANAWLGAHRGQPVFLFVHLFDLHTPYRLAPAKGTNEPETAGYDAELGYIDQILGRFRQSLIDNGWWKKSLIILAADHGESLGDHGELSHGYFIYQSTLRVPLIVHWPSGEHPDRVSEPCGLIDVAPTILDALHFAAPPSFDGMSLLRQGTHQIYSESVYARDSFRWAALRSLRMDRWKYIEAPRAELYDLEKDPLEQSNVIRANEAVAARLRTEISRLMAKHARANPPAAREKALGALGYVAGGSREARRDGPDPKDRLAEYQIFDRSLDAMYSQKLDAAIRGFHQVLAQDHGNLPARGSLGDAYMRAGKTEDAVREWTTALAEDPEYAPAAQALGEHYMRQQDWTRAKAYLQQALAAAPGDTAVRAELGVVEGKLGKP